MSICRSGSRKMTSLKIAQSASHFRARSSRTSRPILLVFLHLLETDADFFAEEGLGEAEFLAPVETLEADMRVDLLRRLGRSAA